MQDRTLPSSIPSVTRNCEALEIAASPLRPTRLHSKRHPVTAVIRPDLRRARKCFQQICDATQLVLRQGAFTPPRPMRDIREPLIRSPHRRVRAVRAER
jgi:hypothetical protein